MTDDILIILTIAIIFVVCLVQFSDRFEVFLCWLLRGHFHGKGPAQRVEESLAKIKE